MISICKLSKCHKGHMVLEDVSLHIEKNKIVGLIGVNGAGKSTLLSILAGVSKADSGSVTFNIDGNFFEPFQDRKHLIGYVPQINPLMEDVSALDNLKLWYRGNSKRLKEDLNSGYLYSLGINDFLHKKVAALSGGMKKRLSIGIAMAGNPSVMLLDEPGAALDILCRNDIRKYMADYRENGGTVVIATHDFDEISMCDQLFHIKNGNIIPMARFTTQEELCNYLQK